MNKITLELLRTYMSMENVRTVEAAGTWIEARPLQLIAAPVLVDLRVHRFIY